MLFKSKIPERLLENPNANNFVKVLDGLQQHKEGLIHKGNRFYNPVLLTEMSFLRKLVEEFGYPKVPADFPKQILDNMFLNAERVFKLKGSKLGLEYFFRVMTCGNPVIDDFRFYPKAAFIIPSDIAEAGYLFTEADHPLSSLYLFDGEDHFSPRFLKITVSTPYWNLVSLKNYITQHITKFIPFVDANTTVEIVFNEGVYDPNPHANQYFVDRDAGPLQPVILGAPVLSGNFISTHSNYLSWDIPQGALYYRLERSNDAAFTVNNLEIYYGINNDFVDEVSAGTYFYRVKAEAPAIFASAFSNTKQVSTNVFIPLSMVSSVNSWHRAEDAIEVPSVTYVGSTASLPVAGTSITIRCFNPVTASFTTFGIWQVPVSVTALQFNEAIYNIITGNPQGFSVRYLGAGVIIAVPKLSGSQYLGANVQFDHLFGGFVTTAFLLGGVVSELPPYVGTTSFSATSSKEPLKGTPLNGVPVLSSEDFQSEMVANTNFPDLSVSGLTVYLVAKQTGGAADDKGVFITAGGAYNNLRISRGFSDTAIFAGANTSGSAQAITPFPENTWHTIRFSTGGVQQNLVLNNAGSYMRINSPSAYFATPLVLFSRGGSHFGKKQIAEIIIFEGVHEPLEFHRVETYLKDKYNHY